MISATSTTVLCILLWGCCRGGRIVEAVSVSCRSEFVTVADTTSFPIGGCYRQTRDHGKKGRASAYISSEGGDVERRRQTMIIWQQDDRAHAPQWAIGEMLASSSPSKMCVSSTGPMDTWECADGAVFEELVTCGCANSDDETLDRFQAAAATAAAGGGDGGSDSGSGGSRRDKIREAGIRGEGNFVAVPAGSTVVGRVLEENVTGDFERFWMWVIIAGAVFGFVVLCCVGWYIQNPFFCQKEPPADPSVQAEDAAPQAPKTAFQPWGASAPPPAPPK